jgi:hypothetical protein
MQKGTMNEQSITSVLQALSVNGKGSSELWSRLESIIRSFHGLSPKSIASVAYSFSKRQKIEPATLHWLYEQVNECLQSKRVPLNHLAVMLWSLTTHPHL